MRFEIDDKGGLWDIVSQSIYTNELDFIRELLQNSIDAVLKVVYQNPKVVLPHKSPRSWRKQSDSVFVCYSEKEKTICVIDYGIGMDDDDLKNYLFKVSSTGKMPNGFRTFEFPGIAQYGIGFVSCLINAETIKLYTSRNGKDLYKVSLENSRNYAFIETQDNKAKYTGTSVVLKLRQQFKYSEIKNYILRTFVYPSVKIQIVDFDREAKRQAKGDNPSITELLFSDEPYEIVTCLSELKEKNAPALRKLEENKKTITVLQKKLEALAQYYKESYYRINKIPNYKGYNKKVQALWVMIERNGIERIIKPPLLTEDMIHRYDEDTIASKISKVFDDDDHKLNNALAHYMKQIEEHTIQVIEVGFDEMVIPDDWKYLVVKFNHELELVEIKKSKETVPLQYGTGIVFIRHKEIDYDFGLEYISINGFLFDNGKICNRIVKLTPSHDENYDEHHSSFTIGINGWGYDIRSDVGFYFAEKEIGISDDDYEDDEGYDISFIRTGKARVSNSYDDISIKNNQIKRNLDLDIDCRFPSYIYDSYSTDEIIGSRASFDMDVEELRKIMNLDQQLFYQDGIAIPSHLCSLFPMGFFRIICNCTADARMKLNVTRHKPSEIRSDVVQWISNVGQRIQETILNKLDEALRELNLEIEYDDVLWIQNDEIDFFDFEALRSLKNMVRRMKNLHN